MFILRPSGRKSVGCSQRRAIELVLTSIIKRAVAVCVVGSCLFVTAGCSGSNPGAPVSQSEADQQNKLTEQGAKNAPVVDEATRQNQLTGGAAAGQSTQGK